MLLYLFEKAMEIIYLCEGDEQLQIKEMHLNDSNRWDSNHIYTNRYTIIKWIFDVLGNKNQTVQQLNSDGSLWTDVINV